MTPPLTQAQQAFVRAVLGEGETTAALAAKQAVTVDAARNTMKRLEARGLVVGTGSGQERTWTATDEGRELVGESHEPESPIRIYYVLEETTLEALVEQAVFGKTWKSADDLLELLKGRKVYEKVSEPQARNTEHALRQAAKDVYEQDGGDAVLIAVADRNWKPTPIRVQTHKTVSVG